MYKLYNVKAWGSLAIHCLLEELEVPYTNIWMTGDQVRAPEFLAISPLGQIPALGLDDGRSLFESAAIVSFLVVAHQHAVATRMLRDSAIGREQRQLRMPPGGFVEPLNRHIENPEPKRRLLNLLTASGLLPRDPARCVYVGDDERDIVAGLAAGMGTVAATYGYLGQESDISRWNAHLHIDSPMDLLKFLNKA
jgi:hypothetical protein